MDSWESVHVVLWSHRWGISGIMIQLEVYRPPVGVGALAVPTVISPGAQRWLKGPGGDLQKNV